MSEILKPITPCAVCELRRARRLLRCARDRDKIRAQKKAEYLRNKEAHQARARAYYLANAESIKAKVKAWRERNPERAKKTKDEYSASHREELAKKQLARYYARHDEYLAIHAARRASNRENQRAFARAKSATISDQYVREQLAKYSPISMQDFPQELVEAKRLQILLKRITQSKRRQKLNAL